MRSILRIALKRLRAPLIAMASVFALSTLGLTLVPGIDASGQPWRMTLFEAFYFVTYTATTIGFGELPQPFTDQQRVFVTVIIYLSVIGWAWLLGSLLNLVQEKAFQQALTDRRFRRAVTKLDQPFYLVCGLGDTGMAVIGALQRLGHRMIAIDKDERTIQQLEIDGVAGDVPSVVADASSPATLTAAGLLKPECKGVLALCNDEETNLAVAIATSILRPELPVVGRADSKATAASMSSLGTFRVIDPFAEFGEHLALAMRAPELFRLIHWLTSVPDNYLLPSVPARIPTAPGHWIVCGFGRLGHEVAAALERGGFSVTVIDSAGSRIEGHHAVRGRGADRAVLHQAGIDRASGIVAGTDDDAENLATAIAARRAKQGIFIIARQNSRSSQMLFAKFGANITMVPSDIVANRCIAALRTPLLADFLDAVRTKDELWAFTLAERLRDAIGNKTPHFWTAVVESERPRMTVSDYTTSCKSGAIVLRIIRSDGDVLDVPDGDIALKLGDTLLLAGVASQSSRAST